ncbi:MAG: replication-associated recombination protein A [Actinomycetaceae bacterium]|nr:replication-associated recombination protein A [Actinomycetaceae bacterium]MDY6083158.1 replication-associated recombination protein A [Actinomycetaceae bacterium]
MDLFDAAGTDDVGLPEDSHAPLAVRMRPRTVDDIVGQDDVLAPGTPLRRLMDPETRSASSVFLWGPPGVGKTTIAYVIARAGQAHFEEVSAVAAGVKELRAVIDAARHRLVATGQRTVLFVDEVHRFSKTQQDALLPAVENAWVTLVAATTENPSFSVVAPLLSRSLLVVLHPLTDTAMNTLVDRALASSRGLAGQYSLDDDARSNLIRLSSGDGRRVLTLLEAAADGARQRGETHISTRDVSAAASSATVMYDHNGDEHYDVISAFIKSVRGSDVDAALHYLARMLVAGEDPRFIARRLMISAAEDVGMADPSALQTATAAAQSVALVGMPEARIILAEATVHLATAPKSNRSYQAINAAIADVKAGKGGPVPLHLRNATFRGADDLGYHDGYIYAHDEPEAIASLQYLPDDLVGTEYYQPSDRGWEAKVAPFLRHIRSILRRRN